MSFTLPSVCAALPTWISTGAHSVAMILLLVGLFFCLLRLGIGPTLADRVVALDLISILTVGLILVDAVRSDQPPYLRPALLLGLLGFLATVAFAYHLKRRGGLPDEDRPPTPERKEAGQNRGEASKEST